MIRTDLLELSTEALIALSNVGFVKRATKEIADGKIPELTLEDNGSITASFSDGYQTKLPIGSGLRDANCSCPASGMCRHRISLVLTYQASHSQVEEKSESTPVDANWSVTEFIKQLDTIPKSVMTRALKLLQHAMVVQVSKGTEAEGIPFARLPMCDIRFYAKSNLAHARCDCIQQTICEHIVIAVWAFEQAEAKQSDFQALTIEVTSPQKAGLSEKTSSTNLFDRPQVHLFEQTIHDFLYILWSNGSGQPLSVLTPLLGKLLTYADTLQWCWMSETLKAVETALHQQHNRSTRYHPVNLLNAVTEILTRLLSAKQMQNLSLQGELPLCPASEILGIGVKGEIQLSHLKLIGLGAQFWADIENEGVSLIFIDPDTFTIMTIERKWPKSTDTEEKIELNNRRIAGNSVKKLATSQVITNVAKRRANGIIEIASQRQSTSVFSLFHSSWDTVSPPIKYASASALKHHLLQSLPDFIRPKQLIDQLFILPVTEIIGWGWDAALQCLEIQMISTTLEEEPVVKDSNNTVIIHFQYDPVSPQAVDVLAHALLNQPTDAKFISGIAKLKFGQLYLTPLAVLGADKVHMLYCDKAAPFTLDKLIDLHTSSPTNKVLLETEEWLARLLQIGIRHQNNKMMTELSHLANEMKLHGFEQLSEQLTSLSIIFQSNDFSRLSKNLSITHQLLKEIMSKA